MMTPDSRFEQPERSDRPANEVSLPAAQPPASIEQLELGKGDPVLKLQHRLLSDELRHDLAEARCRFPVAVFSEPTAGHLLLVVGECHSLSTEEDRAAFEKLMGHARLRGYEGASGKLFVHLYGLLVMRPQRNATRYGYLESQVGESPAQRMNRDAVVKELVTYLVGQARGKGVTDLSSFRSTEFELLGGEFTGSVIEGSHFEVGLHDTVVTGTEIVGQVIAEIQEVMPASVEVNIERAHRFNTADQISALLTIINEWADPIPLCVGCLLFAPAVAFESPWTLGVALGGIALTIASSGGRILNEHLYRKHFDKRWYQLLGRVLPEGWKLIGRDPSLAAGTVGMFADCAKPEVGVASVGVDHLTSFSHQVIECHGWTEPLRS